MTIHRPASVAVIASLVCAQFPALAQSSNGTAAPAKEDLKGETSADTVPVILQPAADEKIDESSMVVPALDYPADPLIEKDFDKYYYFHRDNTDFRSALADIRDCDNLSRGLASPYGYAQAPYPYTYTMAGALGGAIGNLMVAVIFGSAEKRATRRINMRRCMSFKGYQRYGLPKDIWDKFNFEEGLANLSEEKRQVFLKQQAKIASGDHPKTKALGR